MDSIMMQVIFWATVSLVSFGIISYMVFTCPEYEEMEDGTMVRKDQ